MNRFKRCCPKSVGKPRSNCGTCAPKPVKSLSRKWWPAHFAGARLVEQGRPETAPPTPLVIYAVRQVRAGRRVGCRQNSQDVLSSQARRIHGFSIERLDRHDPHDGAWNEQLVEDRRAGPAETAAARFGFGSMVAHADEAKSPNRESMSLGESTGSVASQFGLTAGRVSQLRNWLGEHWEQFQDW